MKNILGVILLCFLCFGCKKEMPTEKPGDDTNGQNNQLTDTIYIGGSFSLADNPAVNNIAMWDGKNWHPLGKGIRGKNVDVECMAFYKGELYVGGFLDSAGEVAANHIAKWNGKEWSAVGNGIDGRVKSLLEYKGELYAGGWFYSTGGKSDNIVRWNGITWSSVGEGLSDEVYTLAIYKDLLYAGGWFSRNAQGYFNANKIARWDGTKWDTVESGLTEDASNGGWVYALTVYNNKLYASGNFNRYGSIRVSNIAKWNDTVWQFVGNFTLSNRTYSSAVYNNELHIAGESDSKELDSTPYYAIWNGTSLNLDKFSFDDLPYCLYSSAEYLYVGGSFTEVNGKKVNGIFRWDGNKIETLGSGVQGDISSILSK